MNALYDATIKRLKGCTAMYTQNWKMITGSISVLLVITLLISGCTRETTNNQSTIDEKAHTIKIMYDYDEIEFYNQYGTLFTSKYPNIDMEIINMQLIESSGELTDETIYQFIEKEKPDVVLLSMKQYETLASEGKLYDLELLISQNSFDLDGMHPSIIQFIREKSFGKLFGLAPSFNSEVLLYNADLFLEYGIEPPTNSMSWEEIFALAKLFPNQENDQAQILGFGLPMYSQYADLAYTIGLTNGLSMLNEDRSQILLHTDSWKQVFQTVIDVADTDSVLLPDAQNLLATSQDYYNDDPFISGRLAMKLVNSYEIQMLTEAEQVVGKENMPRWDIVTAPVAPNNRNQSNSFNIPQIYAIHTESANIEAAWQFIQYIHSAEFARVHSKIPYAHLLQSRTSFIPDISGVSMEPFYMLEPSNSMDPLYGTPLGFHQTLMPIIDDELQNVINNHQTLEDAIINMETRAQEALVQANVNKSL